MQLCALAQIEHLNCLIKNYHPPESPKAPLIYLARLWSNDKLRILNRVYDNQLEHTHY